MKKSLRKKISIFEIFKVFIRQGNLTNWQWMCSCRYKRVFRNVISFIDLCSSFSTTDPWEKKKNKTKQMNKKKNKRKTTFVSEKISTHIKLIHRCYVANKQTGTKLGLSFSQLLIKVNYIHLFWGQSLVWYK